MLCVPLQKLCGKLKTEARQKKKQSTNGRSLVPDALALDLAIVIRNGLIVGTERCSVLEAEVNSGLELRLRPSEEPHDCNTDDIENQASDREALRVHAMPSNVLLCRAGHGNSRKRGALSPASARAAC